MSEPAFDPTRLTSADDIASWFVLIAAHGAEELAESFADVVAGVERLRLERGMDAREAGAHVLAYMRDNREAGDEDNYRVVRRMVMQAAESAFEEQYR